MQENSETKLIAAEVYEMIGNKTTFNGSETTETKWSMDAGKWLFLLAFCSLQIFIGSIANFVVIASIFLNVIIEILETTDQSFYYILLF